eukprot:TRINITY_DN5058_c0_g1_i1.p1 TRINITY_DN5058_c0_g1~~TRINITY_DN5058_c0_g1_i1.p1  ORF type:complete len:283 (+),score=26.28 TRINITY_DN5058_c0_g1_i1:510-1358(+)
MGLRVPAMINIHGYSSNPYYVNLLSGIPSQVVGTNSLQAGAYGWVIASPVGTAQVFNPTCCSSDLTADECRVGKALDSKNPCAWNAGGCCGTATSSGVDDVVFFRSLVDWLVNHACVEASNVFAMGFSNGAMMSNRLACEAADIFRGVAPFEGAIRFGGDFRSCKPAKAVSWISFCGTADGACKDDQQATMQTFKSSNNCSGRAPSPTYVTPTSRCEAYTDCADGTIVETCWNKGMGHSFSGHLRPGTDIPPGYQPATNIDGFKYVMNRLSLTLQSTRVVSV